jgi:hypothetical protein
VVSLIPGPLEDLHVPGAVGAIEVSAGGDRAARRFHVIGRLPGFAVLILG